MHTPDAPLIGIPMYPVRDNGNESSTEVGGTRAYYQRLLECGALPVFIPLCAPSVAELYMDRLDGILIPGGHDVDPALFGEAPHPRLGIVQRERDDFEIAIVRAALSRDMPLLGICRGIQVLNVAQGGTLIQDIPSEAPSTVNHRGKESNELPHDVVVIDGTLLAQALGAGRQPVNSLHHQGIRNLAPGLAVSATCSVDGLVEAIEMPGKRFVAAVQFHPERLPQRFLSLFQAFVQACAKR